MNKIENILDKLAQSLNIWAVSVWLGGCEDKKIGWENTDNCELVARLHRA